MIECIKEIAHRKHWNETECESKIKDSNSGMEVNLTKLPKHGLIITMPEQGAHLGMASQKEGLFVFCDNLILIENNDCIDVYFIEMKQSLGRKQKKKATDQILHTIPIWDYIASMVNIHFEKNKKTNSYFTIIVKRSSSSLDKQKVRSESSEIFTCRGKKFKIIYSASTIPLSHLK